jgi:hypothetical protein
MASLNEAKAEVKAASKRVAAAFNALIGARVTAAAAVMFAVAFGMALLITPTRLPAIGGLDLVSLGLPPFEFGKEKEVAGEIIDAARRQGGADRARDFLAQNPGLIPYLNGLGLLAALLVAGVCVREQTRHYQRGVAPL